MSGASAVRVALLGAVALGAGMVALGLATSTDMWANFFAHDLRTHRNGGEIIEATMRGAAWWRVALCLGGAAVIVIVSSIARLESRHGGTEARSHGAEAEPRSGPWIVVGFAIVALIVRLPRLAESLWYDEISALLDFTQYGPGAVMGNYFVQSNHILHQLLCCGSIALLGGVNEISVRLPALLASILTVPAMTFLAREVTFPRDEDNRASSAKRTFPLWAWTAAFAALAPVLLLEAVESRGYALMILASTCSTALLLRAWRTSDSATAWWLLYAIVAALGVWAHLVTVCVPLGHGVVLAWWLARGGDRRRGAAALLALILAAVLTVTLYSPALPDLLRIRREFSAVDGNEPTLLGPEGVHALLAFGGAWSLAALPGLLLAGIGVMACRRDATLRRAAVASLAGVPVAIALAWFGDSWLYARFLLFGMPGALLLLAAGTTLIARRSPPVALLAALILIGTWTTDLLLRPPKQPLRDVVQFVAASRTPRERVAVIGLIDNVIAYYGAAAKIEIVPTGPLGRDLAIVLDRVQPSWIIVMYPRSVDAEKFELLDDAGFRLEASFPGWVDWTNGDVRVYRREGRRDGGT